MFSLIRNFKKDSIRFYMLGSDWKRKIEHYGCKKPVDLPWNVII
jgi:CRISPR-associated protein Cas2